jgi:glycosyltransferase involved in cell wall biosynthesis
MPEISVLMSVYNGEAFLNKAIDSILTQSFTDFEFIIINDGSTDGSSAILKNYARQDSRIILIEQSNQGLIAALNTGLQSAKTNLIARMDADDIALPDRLKIQKNHMDINPNILALGSSVIIIDETDRAKGTITYPQKDKVKNYSLHQGSPLAHPAVMMRKNAILSIGGYRSAYKHAEDYDLWLRLLKIGDIDNIQTPLLQYREHSQKISVQNAQQQALISVIARHASQSKPDPTENLTKLSRETLKLFGDDPIRCEWEIIDIMASGLLMSPNKDTIKLLATKIPSKAPKTAEYFAVRCYLKFAKASYLTKAFTDVFVFTAKAFCTSPVKTVSLIASKIL